MKPENTSGRTELGAAFSTFYALLSLGHYRYSPPLSGTTAFFNWARFWLSLSILDPTKTRPTGQCRPGEPDKDWQRGTTVGFWDQLDWKTAKHLECCQVLIYHHLAAILWILNWGMFFKPLQSLFVQHQVAVIRCVTGSVESHFVTSGNYVFHLLQVARP